MCPPLPTTGSGTDKPWDLRHNLETLVLPSLNWSAVTQGSHLFGTQAVVYLLRDNDAGSTPPLGSTQNYHFYQVDEYPETNDPIGWGYWAEDWTDEAGNVVLPTSPKLASQVWIAGPQTPISVINDLINISKPSYTYLGSVMGGVGSDPILMNDGINKIQLDINFAAQSANALIEFMTVGGMRWESTLNAGSADFTLGDPSNGYRYKIDMDNTRRNRTKKGDFTWSVYDATGGRNIVQGHFYGNNAEYTGGTFMLDGGGESGHANGVFKAKRVLP
jgi:hypothetical protein